MNAIQPGAARPPVFLCVPILQRLPQQFVIRVRHGNAWPDSTGFRVILAERKGRKFLEQTLKAKREGGTAPAAPRGPDSGH